MAKKKPSHPENTASEVILIKPGVTDYDQQGRIQGNLDIPLNPEGADEVQALAKSLDSHDLDAIYSPTCEPSLETAQALAKLLGTKIKKMAKMGNVDLGLWQGMKTDEVRHKQQRVYRQWQERPETVCPPEGETIDDARARMACILTKIIKRHRDGKIGLVVPEPMASLVRQFLLGNSSELGDLWAATADRPTYESFTVDLVNGDKGAEKPVIIPISRGVSAKEAAKMPVKPITLAAE